MKSIIITGCSWAAGEWSTVNTDYLISHPGLTQYFTDAGYNVINLSQPGGDNWGSYHRLACFLQTNKHLNIDKIYLFQTDIGRDLCHLNTECNNNLVGMLDLLYENFYENLNSLADKHNVIINVLGGVTDVVTNLTKYNHLNLSVPSITCLLLSEEALPTRLVDYAGFEYLSKHGADKKQLYNLMEHATKRQTLWKQNADMFYPDGVHPNRHAHKIIFNKLLDTI